MSQNIDLELQHRLSTQLHEHLIGKPSRRHSRLDNYANPVTQFGSQNPLYLDEVLGLISYT
jgi:hypothetical protein